MTATFTVALPAGVTSHTFTLVSYTAPAATFDANTAYLQQIYDSASITVTANGTYSLTVLIPNCYYQIDFVCDQAIDHFGPAGSNIFYSAQNRLFSADNDGTTACTTTQGISTGDFAAPSFWSGTNGQTLIKSFNGSSTSTQLARWLATTFPNLFGPGRQLLHAMVSNGALPLQRHGGHQLLQQVLGRRPAGAGHGPVGVCHEQLPGRLDRGQQGHQSGTARHAGRLRRRQLQRRQQRGRLRRRQQHQDGGDAAAGGLQRQHGRRRGREQRRRHNLHGNQHRRPRQRRGAEHRRGSAYTPADIRTAYGVNNLNLDGSGQTIAVVVAYDNPAIFQSVDAFDAQFGATGDGPTLYDQYGPAWSFLSVMGQDGSSTLPAIDPTGAGVSNWEMETTLDVQWIHAMAPGAHILLVEANSAAAFRT